MASRFVIPDDDMLLVPRNVFQNLHSAARSAYQSFCRFEQHSPESAAAMEILNESIDMGHEILGTSRSYADKYIAAVGGVTQVQANNIRAILSREGLSVEDLDKTE